MFNTGEDKGEMCPGFQHLVCQLSRWAVAGLWAVATVRRGRLPWLWVSGWELSALWPDHCELVLFADWIRIECFSRGSGGPGPGPDRGSWCWADWPVACSNFDINVNKYAQYLFTILSILLALASSLHKQAFKTQFLHLRKRRRQYLYWRVVLLP